MVHFGAISAMHRKCTIDPEELPHASACLLPFTLRTEANDSMVSNPANRQEETMAEPKTPDTEALAAFIAHKAEIDRLLEQLLAHSHEHLNLAPEEVHWGHVGELDDWLACLRRVAKQAGVLAQDA